MSIPKKQKIVKESPEESEEETEADRTPVDERESQDAPTVDESPENKDKETGTQNNPLPQCSGVPHSLSAPIKTPSSCNSPALSPEVILPIPIKTTVKRVQRKRGKTAILTSSYQIEFSEAIKRTNGVKEAQKTKLK